MSNIVKYLYIALIALFITGCGGGGGSTSAVSGGGSTPTPALPTEPSQQITYGSQKVLSKDYTEAKIAFEAVRDNSSSTDYQKRLAYTGINYCNLKLSNISLGDDSMINDLLSITDRNQSFSSSHTTAEVISIPKDAYMLLGLCYLVRNKIGDEVNALKYLQELGGGSSNFDDNFKFETEIGLGISNAEAHSLIAMAYFYNGDSSKSLLQLSIAKSLDPNGNYELVTEIDTALSTMGI